MKTNHKKLSRYVLTSAASKKVLQPVGFSESIENVDWDREIAALQDTPFTSVTEALEAIAHQVVDKISNQPGGEGQDIYEFVLNLLENNEEVVEIVQDSLVRGKE